MDIKKLLHLFHIVVVGGLFLYVGMKREKISSGLFSVLFYLGIFIVIYHLYKAYGYWEMDKAFWVNLIHILIVGPVLVYIGYNGEKTSRKFFEILLMLGFAAIGYHGYYLF